VISEILESLLLQHDPCLEQRVEIFAVELLGPNGPVESLDETVLLWLSFFDVGDCDTEADQPLLQRAGNELAARAAMNLRPVVAEARSPFRAPRSVSNLAIGAHVECPYVGLR
jgi:hypothetical protein